MDGFIFLVRVMSSKRFAIKSMASALQKHQNPWPAWMCLKMVMPQFMQISWEKMVMNHGIGLKIYPEIFRPHRPRRMQSMPYPQKGMKASAACDDLCPGQDVIQSWRHRTNDVHIKSRAYGNISAISFLEHHKLPGYSRTRLSCWWFVKLDNLGRCKSQVTTCKKSLQQLELGSSVLEQVAQNLFSRQNETKSFRPFPYFT